MGLACRAEWHKGHSLVEEERLKGAAIKVGGSGKTLFSSVFRQDILRGRFGVSAAILGGHSEKEGWFLRAVFFVGDILMAKPSKKAVSRPGSAPVFASKCIAE